MLTCIIYEIWMKRKSIKKEKTFLRRVHLEKK